MFSGYSSAPFYVSLTQLNMLLQELLKLYDNPKVPQLEAILLKRITEEEARHILFFPDQDQAAYYQALIANPPKGAPEDHPQRAVQVSLRFFKSIVAAIHSPRCDGSDFFLVLGCLAPHGKHEGWGMICKDIRGIFTTTGRGQSLDSACQDTRSASCLQVGVQCRLHLSLVFMPESSFALPCARQRRLQNQIPHLSLLYLQHRKSWGFVSTFILSGGLHALCSLFTHDHPVVRLKAITTLVSITAHEGFDWFRPVLRRRRNPGGGGGGGAGEDNTTEARLHRALLGLRLDPSFISGLIANSWGGGSITSGAEDEGRGQTFPGGCLMCLEVGFFSFQFREPRNPDNIIHENLPWWVRRASPLRPAAVRLRNQ